MMDITKKESFPSVRMCQIDGRERLKIWRDPFDFGWHRRKKKRKEVKKSHSSQWRVNTHWHWRGLTLASVNPFAILDGTGGGAPLSRFQTKRRRAKQKKRGLLSSSTRDSRSWCVFCPRSFLFDPVMRGQVKSSRNRHFFQIYESILQKLLSVA